MKQLIDQSHLRNLIKEHIETVKKKNALFSMRAFAKKAGVSVGGLSSFLAGKTNYSLEMMEKLVNTIVTSPEERKDILKNYNYLLLENIREASQSSQYEYRLLKEEELAFIKDWYHYAILFLIQTKDFQLDILWIAKRLGISSEEVEFAMARLLHLKLVNMNEDGTISLTNNYVKTSDDVANTSLREMHKQMLGLAAHSLENDPVKVRDITSLTIPVNVKNIPKAKEIIRKCQDDLMNVLAVDERDEVYHVLFCLYPVSRQPNEDSSTL